MIQVITPVKVVRTLAFDLIAVRGNDQVAGYPPKNESKILVILIATSSWDGSIR